ncbi:MAG: hypothetical protein ABI843_10055 [Dokdonella sp.]
MRTFACFAAAGMLAVVAFPANAATIAYGEAFDTLYRFDLEAHEATLVGGAGRYAGQDIGNISGLTTAAGGSLYAIAGGFKLLIAVNGGTGSADVIGSLGLAGEGDPNRNDALDLNMISGCDGKLWLTSAVANKIWTVDATTGTTTLVGPTGHTITGLVALGDALYGAGGKGDNNFYRIDKTTGAATLIGPFGAGLTHWANSISMSFDADGALWAVINYVPPENDSDPIADWSDLAKIDPTTGALTIVGPITGPDALRGIGMKGFTLGPTQCTRGATGPMPAPLGAPWMLALLGSLLGFVGVVCVRRRFDV